MLTLKENLSYDQAKIITESSQDGKSLYMEGIFVQGDKRNQNSRVYPVNEISKAVKAIQEKIETLKKEYEEINNNFNSLEESVNNLRNDSINRATNYVINCRLDKIKKSYVIEKTPLGNVLMIN